MMRFARTPQLACGGSRAPGWRRRAAGAGGVCLLACLVAALALALAPAPAFAQDPSLGKRAKTPSAFPKQKGGIFGTPKKIDRAQPLYLQGDELIYDTKGNRVIARGNVEIYYNDYILTADEVTYNQDANTLTAAGNVMLKEPNGNIIRADRYTLTDDFRDGFVQSLSVVARDDTRIAAERLVRRDGNVNEYQNAKFTPCKSDGATPPLWCVAASRAIHDQQAATITYQDAQFEFFGVPVFYLPYFQHPDPSVKHQSGFLSPTIGHSDNFGFTTEIPYYFALAPNYDFLFSPMYMSKLGVMWQGTWRHRLAGGQYYIKFAAIDQSAADLPDSVPDKDSLDGWRGTLETKGKFSLSSWWHFGWDVTLESDDTFRRFYKFDSVLLTDRVNSIYLTGQSDRNYFGMTLYQFGGLTFDDTPTSESWVHPVIDYNYVFANPVLGGELSWNTNVVSLNRSFIDNPANPVVKSRNEDMNRIVTEVNWRRRMTDAIGITYTPFGQLRGDLYQINDFVDPVTQQTVQSESVARGRATAGATVSYPWIANTGSASHIIEPIGQVIVRQASVRQTHLPDEDARSLVFDDTNLFDPQKTSGYDRIETGTRVNAGLQYTFQLNSGGYARLLAGQSFHLSGENIYMIPGKDADGNPIFSPVSGLETDRSDYVLGAYIAPTSWLRLISQSRLDERDLALRTQYLAAGITAGPLYAQAAYSYSPFDPELNTSAVPETNQDITGTIGWQLTNRWSLQGSMRYDIDNEQRLLDSIQLKYADECFVLTASYNETFITDPARGLTPDRSIMLRFELKHLGQFAYKTDPLDHVFGDQPVR